MKRLYRTLYRVALFTFLVNAILPFFTVYPPMPATPPAAVTAQQGELIPICSTEGFRWVTYAQLQSEKEKHNAPAHYKCGLCFLAAHGLGHLALPSGIALADAHIAEQSAQLQSTALAIIFERQSTLHSRAPPTLLLS